MPHPARAARPPALLWLPLWLLLAAPAADASSGIVLPFPPSFEDVALETFDTTGRRIGTAEMSFSRDDEKRRVYIRGITKLDNGAQNEIAAELEIVEDGSGLRLLYERSHSFDENGIGLAVLEVDHRTRKASCTPYAGPAEAAEVVDLPENDRVANVPMNLLFLPLVKGDVDRVEFQIFLCGGGAKLMDFVALRAPRVKLSGKRRIVEIRYGPDLGRMVSWLAAAVVPKLSFWFDDTEQGDYVAHRMPLYSKGPDVVVVRGGVSPLSLLQ